MLHDNLMGWEGDGGGGFKREGPYVYLIQIHVDYMEKIIIISSNYPFMRG